VDVNRISAYLPETQKNLLQACLNQISQITPYQGVNSEYPGAYFPSHGPEKGSYKADKAEKDLFGLFEEHVKSLQKKLGSLMNHHMQDPITALGDIGKAQLSSIDNLWRTMYGSDIPLPVGKIVEKEEGWQSIIQGFTKLAKAVLFMPLLTFWITLNGATGAILVYYVPLIPFLLFFFSALTWFGLVVGIMVGAPLIALGITHPEGHKFWGKVEQAIMKIVDLFLRPTLMILGLIFGMILCFVVFNFFNYAYNIAIQGVQANLPTQGLLVAVHQTAMMIIYSTSVLAIVPRCFAAIYELPNQALRWLGGSPEGHAEAEVLSQVKSGIDNYGQGALGQMSRDAFSEQGGPHLRGR
jgi:defect-in-organelle-trafficking protein DotA